MIGIVVLTILVRNGGEVHMSVRRPTRLRKAVGRQGFGELKCVLIMFTFFRSVRF
jgi:hypothetical protein